MSSPQLAETISSSDDLQSLLSTALTEYAQRTGTDLITHPLKAKLETLNSTSAVVDQLQHQARSINGFQNEDHKAELLARMKPIVDTLIVLSTSVALGDGTGLQLEFDPGKLAFIGIAILLDAAKDPNTDYEELIETCEFVGSVFGRLKLYAKVPFTVAATETVLKAMIEFIHILGFTKKLVSEGDLEGWAQNFAEVEEIDDAFRVLDRLEQEESQLVVTEVLDVVYGLLRGMTVVMAGGDVPTEYIRSGIDTIKQTETGENKLNRDQLQSKCRVWLSAFDPSVNYNARRQTRIPGTKGWFIYGSTFREWKFHGSLLWIRDKASTGKSITCTAVVEALRLLRINELSFVAYFDFDYREPATLSARSLLSSLLVQLCAQSNSCYDILSNFYLAHGSDIRPPSVPLLSQCLKDMLARLSRDPVYITIDGLNECLSSGSPSPREEVLGLLKELVDLRYQNHRICILSRAEPDIQTILEPLTSHLTSLHAEKGQAEDISAFVSFVMESHSNMSRWFEEDKVYVMKALSRRATGVFEWAYRQLRALRNSLRRHIRLHVDTTPLDVNYAYEEVLTRVTDQNYECAFHMLECLAIAGRHLRFAEFAEVITMDFRPGQLPKFEISWREDKLEQAVLSIGSDLISITNFNNDRYAELALTVREFLTSDIILASQTKGVPRYQVRIGPAHITLAEICLSILVILEDVDLEKIKTYPLASYAAKYWVYHAKAGGGSEAIDDGALRILDQEKPYFAAWVWLYDIDAPSKPPMETERPGKPAATPLYYAVRHGLYHLIEHLVVKDPQSVNAIGGTLGTPLQAAAADGSLEGVELLLEHGADVNAQGGKFGDALRAAAFQGNVDVVQALVEHGADVNARGGVSRFATALEAAKANEESSSLEVVELLTKYGAR